MTVATQHIFEAAGLGLAPFRFVGIETDADRAAVQREREASGMCFTTNHCTSCDYCSQAIRNAYVIQSADGKRFKVDYVEFCADNPRYLGDTVRVLLNRAKP